MRNNKYNSRISDFHISDFVKMIEVIDAAAEQHPEGCWDGWEERKEEEVYFSAEYSEEVRGYEVDRDIHSHSFLVVDDEGAIYEVECESLAHDIIDRRG